ncbi:formimidoylglutamase [Clostridium sp.]|uniref:formimidoylglutamase n=1 Tax=Clostridium sp. TaxID=1506 RepID=UPI0032166CC9
MFTKNYEPMNENLWQGRIDSYDNYDAFRWHQWVEPLDLKRDDLKPLDGFGFAFLGFCCDEGVKNNKGRSGAMNGPIGIRHELAKMPCTFNKSVQLFDAGDIVVDNISLDEGQNLLSQGIKKLLSLNIFPIVLGGGHETALGNYNGALSHLESISNKPKIGIINFDAHFDLRPYNNEGSSGTMFRQISDICDNKNIDFSYFCVGIQKHSNTVDLFKTADKLGVKYVLAKDIINSDGWQLLRELNNFMRDKDYIYVTICADVFSAAYAPGVSATQTLGLNPEIVINLLKHILKSNRVVTFDICEVAPRFDKDNITSNLAGVIIFSLVNTLCKLQNLQHTPNTEP